MTNMDMKEIQKEVLDALEALFRDRGDAIMEESVKEREEILAAEHFDISVMGESVLGVYGFLEGEDQDAVHKFRLSLVLTDEANPEIADLVREAISFVNNRTAPGYFALDDEGTVLSFRETLLFPVEQTAEIIAEMIGYHILVDLEAVSLWQDILMRLAEGDCSYNDFEDFMKAMDEE